MPELTHVVILGPGFGGIGALKKRRDANSNAWGAGLSHAWRVSWRPTIRR
jgi:hypothetical protein